MLSLLVGSKPPSGPAVRAWILLGFSLSPSLCMSSAWSLTLSLSPNKEINIKKEKERQKNNNSNENKQTKIENRRRVVYWCLDWWLCWSRRGAAWSHPCQSHSYREAVTRHRESGFGVMGLPPRRLTVHSLKPHDVGHGERNGDTPISPAHTRCLKTHSLGYPHRIAWGAGLPCCTVPCATWALSWDSKPCSIPLCSDLVVELRHSAQWTEGLWLVPARSFSLGQGNTSPFHHTQGVLSQCSPEIATKPRGGSLPTRHGTW